MKIPKYWARGTQTALDSDGQKYSFTCWHWSDLSFADAQQRADDRALVVAQMLATGEPLNRYGYGDRPLREEVCQRVTNGQGKEVAVVTRNRYGALVLNAAQAMFIDIDFSDKAGGGGGLKRLFGAPPPPDPVTVQVQRVEAWAAQRPDLGMNIYRTAGGLRCLVTNYLFEPKGADAVGILQALQSDPLYVRLCQAQECFRARLTPKPWRCGFDTPPATYPFQNGALEARSRQWEHDYDVASASYTVCRLLKQVGPADVHPDIAPVLQLHDQMSCSGTDLRLA